MLWNFIPDVLRHQVMPLILFSFPLIHRHLESLQISNGVPHSLNYCFRNINIGVPFCDLCLDSIKNNRVLEWKFTYVAMRGLLGLGVC